MWRIADVRMERPGSGTGRTGQGAATRIAPDRPRWYHGDGINAWEPAPVPSSKSFSSSSSTLVSSVSTKTDLGTYFGASSRAQELRQATAKRFDHGGSTHPSGSRSGEHADHHSSVDQRSGTRASRGKQGSSPRSSLHARKAIRERFARIARVAAAVRAVSRPGIKEIGESKPNEIDSFSGSESDHEETAEGTKPDGHDAG